jgi:hypothetical protein
VVGCVRYASTCCFLGLELDVSDSPLAAIVVHFNTEDLAVRLQFRSQG